MSDLVFESRPDDSQSPDAITYFMKSKIYKPETTDGGFEDQQVPKVSLTKIIASDL